MFGFFSMAQAGAMQHVAELRKLQEREIKDARERLEKLEDFQAYALQAIKAPARGIDDLKASMRSRGDVVLGEMVMRGAVPDGVSDVSRYLQDAIDRLGKVSDGRFKAMRERIEDLEEKQADALQAIKAFMERGKPEGREAAQVLLDEGCFTDPVVVRALRARAEMEGEG
ncbi:MAG: hypothetical protein MRY81_10245 [Donghicola eburneus]|nr:hypothetical protein [Donghicola eburneus]MCI5040052.1 hypothetical protein [Donghicola eburneus]